METIFYPAEEVRQFKNTVVAIGSFDGIHLGHKKIISKVVSESKRIAAAGVIVTFDPHPSKIVSDAPVPILLKTERKFEILEQLGVDIAVIVKFDRAFSRLPAQDFVKSFLVDYLNARIVVTGRNCVFGNGRGGDAVFLSKMGKGLGFRVDSVEPVMVKNEVVSSTRVRELVRDADFEGVRQFLGRPYEIRGNVKKGQARGRAIGYPTANLDIGSALMPGNGVYGGFVRPGGVYHRAVLNVGVRPTFLKRSHSEDGNSNSGCRVVEVHIDDFDASIYGNELSFWFLRKIRDEMEFETVQGLKDRIRKDIEKVRAIPANSGCFGNRRLYK